MDEIERIEKLKELLERSVKIASEEEVGILFSGGLDSGVIAFLAKKFSKISGYTVGIENSKDVEFVKKL